MVEADVLDELLFEAFENSFDKFARDCPHHRLDQRGEPVCTFHESSWGACSLELCPRVKAKLGREKNADNP